MTRFGRRKRFLLVPAPRGVTVKKLRGFPPVLLGDVWRVQKSFTDTAFRAECEKLVTIPIVQKQHPVTLLLRGPIQERNRSENPNSPHKHSGVWYRPSAPVVQHQSEQHRIYYLVKWLV